MQTHLLFEIILKTSIRGVVVSAVKLLCKSGNHAIVRKSYGVFGHANVLHCVVGEREEVYILLDGVEQVRLRNHATKLSAEAEDWQADSQTNDSHKNSTDRWMLERLTTVSSTSFMESDSEMVETNVLPQLR